eukprot:8051752-Prorocentrum_lima.AAC.1
MVKSGPVPSFRARFMSMKAHAVHERLRAQLLMVRYVASQDNPADALTKGLGSQLTRKQDSCSE